MIDSCANRQKEKAAKQTARQPGRWAEINAGCIAMYDSITDERQYSLFAEMEWVSSSRPNSEKARRNSLSLFARGDAEKFFAQPTFKNVND